VSGLIVRCPLASICRPTGGPAEGPPAKAVGRQGTARTSRRDAGHAGACLPTWNMQVKRKACRGQRKHTGLQGTRRPAARPAQASAGTGPAGGIPYVKGKLRGAVRLVCRVNILQLHLMGPTPHQQAKPLLVAGLVNRGHWLQGRGRHRGLKWQHKHADTHSSAQSCLSAHLEDLLPDLIRPWKEELSLRYSQTFVQPHVGVAGLQPLGSKDCRHRLLAQERGMHACITVRV